MSDLEILSATLFALISTYAEEAKALAEEGIPIMEALKVVVAIRLTHDIATYTDPIAAFAWIQTDSAASYIFQATAMMVPVYFDNVNAAIEANIEHRATNSFGGEEEHAMTENEIVILATYQYLRALGTLTVDWDDMEEGGIAWDGLRGAYMMINSIRHGPSGVLEVEVEEEHEDDENFEPNVAGAA